MAEGQVGLPTLLGLESDGRDLFGLAAHKLNTPLACIRGFVSTLVQRGDQLDGETRQQFLQLVLLQSEKLQALVHDFLALARVQGGISAVLRPYRPRTLLGTLLDDLGPEGARVELAGDLDAELQGDSELVALALRPLVENAVVYGPRLQRVAVTVTVGPDATRWDVFDSGRHLTEVALERLFRPFVRADEPYERRGSGAGLGLTLARAYADVVGGTVGGEVREDGTVFWLKVPQRGTEA